MAQLRYNFDFHVEGLTERANAYKYFTSRRSCDQASLEHKPSAFSRLSAVTLNGRFRVFESTVVWTQF
jgi:hypothetical protein